MIKYFHEGKKDDKSVLEENKVETKLEKPTRHWSLDIFNLISIPILKIENVKD